MALGAFVPLTIVLSIHSFGVRGAFGDPVLPHGAAMLTPTAQAVATRAATSRAPAGRVNPRLRNHQQLLSYAGTVLIPPQDLAPFANLELSSVTGPGSDCPIDCTPRYSLEFGSWASGGIRLSGATGRRMFDAQRPPACQTETSYCNASPKVAPQTAATAEYFGDVTVGTANPALVLHLICCAGAYWSVSWYSAFTNDSYTLEMSQHVAEAYGTELSPNNRSAAQQLCDLAGQMIELVSR
jgi:hypothetical protein